MDVGVQISRHLCLKSLREDRGKKTNCFPIPAGRRSPRGAALCDCLRSPCLATKLTLQNSNSHQNFQEGKQFCNIYPGAQKGAVISEMLQRVFFGSWQRDRARQIWYFGQFWHRCLFPCGLCVCSTWTGSHRAGCAQEVPWSCSAEMFLWSWGLRSSRMNWCIHSLLNFDYKLLSCSYCRIQVGPKAVYTSAVLLIWSWACGFCEGVR